MSPPCACYGVHHDVEVIPPPSPCSPPSAPGDLADTADLLPPVANPMVISEDDTDSVVDVTADFHVSNSSSLALKEEGNDHHEDDDVLAGISPSFPLYPSATTIPTIATNPIPTLPLVDSNSSHDIDEHRRCTEEKRELDATFALRRRSRLAGIEGPAFQDMTSKSMRAKARKFDLSRAPAPLADAIIVASLVSASSAPSDDLATLSAIAPQCGAATEDMQELVAVPPSSP